MQYDQVRRSCNRLEVLLSVTRIDHKSSWNAVDKVADKLHTE